MQAGAVIGKAWDMYKAHWRHLVPIAFVVYVLISLLILLLGTLGWLGALLGFVASIAGIFWLQGALVLAVDDVRDGRADLSLTQTLDRVTPHLGTLVAAGLLAGIAIAIGLVLLIVPGLYLMTIWLLIIPAIMLENRGVGESFSRSHDLVRGYGWSVFGVIVLTFLIFIGVGIVFGILDSAVDSAWLSFALNVLLQTVTAPFLALAWTNTYYALRDLKGAEPTAAV
ncbi:MAG TPA: hypothetical protein VFG61_06445 [Gaiellaceae bacterium]|jgi:hypothetical protein|nr:hypothetical protein [Gaiellaceae bacterium]